MMNVPAAEAARVPRVLGRYELLGVLGTGGMARVYLARLCGEAGFQRLYAVKVLHGHLADEPDFTTMLFEEARLAARLHHPNVVPIVDLGSQDGINYVVMEYVEGCALSTLLRKNRDSRPPRVLIPIILDALNGLHAAHSLTDDDGRPMHLVHRDVSSHNIMVGVDGTARITDFGIAKAGTRITTTQPGLLKGKLSSMSPEQIEDAANVDRRSDVFAAGILLWTALTGEPLFQGASPKATLDNILSKPIVRPSTIGQRPPQVLDEICLRALARDRNVRTQSAAEMEESLRTVAGANGLLGSKREVAGWVMSVVQRDLELRRAAIRAATERISAPPSLSLGSDARLSMGLARRYDTPSKPPFSVDPPSHPPPLSGMRRSDSGRPISPRSFVAGVSRAEAARDRRGRRVLLVLLGLGLISGLFALTLRLGGRGAGRPAEGSQVSTANPAEPSPAFGRGAEVPLAAGAPVVPRPVGAAAASAGALPMVAPAVTELSTRGSWAPPPLPAAATFPSSLPTSRPREPVEAPRGGSPAVNAPARAYAPPRAVRVPAAQGDGAGVATPGPPVASPEAKSKSSSWDNDSPLPPP